MVLLLAASLALPAVAQTTTLTITRYGFDNVTVAESKTVTVAWMEQHLPVMGDGVTPYYFQGPTYGSTDLWNPAETLNLTRINETIKGTAIRDLVELVGGMYPGDEVEVRAPDDFNRRLGYANIYTPQARQGPPVLAWWNRAKEDSRVWSGYAWNESMRLFFLADTSSNPYGWHVFGNEDMRQCIASSQWWFRENDEIDYPSVAGLSVTNVSYLRVFPAPRALVVPGCAGLPHDLDANGKYEDVNGNSRTDFADVVLLFNQMTWIAGNEPIPFFDYNANGRIDFADVVQLFNTL
jgi:PKD repeat protein